MSGMLETIAGQLGGAGLGQLSKRLGASESKTQTAMAVALPLLLTALARNSAKPEGAEALHRALEKHDGSVLDNLDGHLSAPNVDEGNGILSHVLGNSRPAIETQVSRATGLDPQHVGALLTTLAPVVMGMLGRKQRQGGLDAGSLSGMLQSEQADLAAKNPALSGLGGLLDGNKDGQITDDLARLGKGLFGGLFGGR